MAFLDRQHLLDRQRLDPRSVTAGRIGGWIFTAVVALVLGGGALVALILSHAPPISWIAMGVLLAVPLTLLALAAQIGPAWRYDTTWFRVDDDGLEFAHGRWWRHHVSIPRSRIQHTDVTQGPFERRFGLGTLVIFTAGTQHAAVPLEGLPHATALALRDALLSRQAALPDAAPSLPPRIGDDDAV
jgi:membrane protein YdbS with pleckstrin-like domain